MWRTIDNTFKFLALRPPFPFLVVGEGANPLCKISSPTTCAKLRLTILSLSNVKMCGGGYSYGTAKTPCLKVLYFKKNIDKFERSLISAQ